MRILGWVVIALVVGCSGESSRVESTKVIDIKPIPDFGTLHLDELTASQWADACDWMVSVQGGSRTVDCVDGMMVTVESSQTCANEMLRPHCLASSLTDCIQARGDRVCGPEPIECIRYYECARSGKPVVTAMHTNL